MNYRFSGTDLFSVSFEDGVQAVQFLRYKAGEYKLDRERFFAGGGSACGGVAFYVGDKPDRSDPNSSDPVCRQSSLLQCIAANDTQSS